MNPLEKIKKRIGEHESFLKERFNVKSIYISSCMGGERREKSDSGLTMIAGILNIICPTNRMNWRYFDDSAS